MEKYVILCQFLSQNTLNYFMIFITRMLMQIISADCTVKRRNMNQTGKEKLAIPYLKRYKRFSPKTAKPYKITQQ